MSWVVTIITCGALRLIFYWWPTLMLFSTHMKCSLQTAEKILVVVSSCYFVCYIDHHLTILYYRLRKHIKKIIEVNM